MSTELPDYMKATAAPSIQPVSQPTASTNPFVPRNVNGQQVMYQLTDNELARRNKAKTKVGSGGGLAGGWSRQGDDSPVKQAWIAAGSPREGQAYFDFVEQARQIQQTPEWKQYEEAHNAKAYANHSNAASDSRITNPQGVADMATTTVPTYMQNKTINSPAPATAVPNMRQPMNTAPVTAAPGTGSAGSGVTRPDPVAYKGDVTAPLAYQFAEDRLTNMVGSNSNYMREAKRQGLEAAAARGQANSSIAAGAAMREAIRAAAPIAQQDAGFTQEEYGRGMADIRRNDLSANDSVRRQNEAGTQGLIEGMLTNQRGDIESRQIGERASYEDMLAGNQSQRRLTEMGYGADLEQQLRDSDTQRTAYLNNLDYQFRNQLADNDAFRQNWANEQSSFRSLYENAMGSQIGLNANMLDRLGQAFIDDPEVYDPQTVQGMLNFFRTQSGNIINSALAGILGDRLGSSGALQPTPAPVIPPGP